jgi:hypothetical protein
MTEIEVLQPPERKDIISNKTEREIRYDRFKKIASLPLHHYDAFNYMETLDDEVDIQSSLVSIQLKNISKYISFLISEIPQIKLKTTKVDVFKKHKLVKENTFKKKYSIPVQMEYSVSCYTTKNNIAINIPKHTTFNVVGVIIPTKIIKNVDSSFLNYVNSLNSYDLLKSGHYGLRDFQSGNYIQSLFSDISPHGTEKKCVYFLSNDDAKKKIKIINDYIKYTNTFYKKNAYALFTYLYTKQFLNRVKKSTPIYSWDSKFTYFNNDKISIDISKQMKYALGNSNYSNDFIFDNMGIFNDINKINMGVLNSDQLLKNNEIKKKAQQDIINFNKLKFKKQLEYAKKQAISLGKFGICQLNKLTPNQLNIVETHYDKMENFYISIKKHSGDFSVINALIWSMDNGTNDMIQKNLNNVIKLIKNLPKKLNNSKEMLKNKENVNLICPHVIDKAKLLIKTYKNDIKKAGVVRETLISSYALVNTADGYFCKICGELIADSDDYRVTKYVSGKYIGEVQQFDRVRSQIWKNTARIITTYVKFKQPPKLKGIIQSITDVLRDEIGAIEINLLKIKSNNRDNIDDLLSIYIVTYIMAILSHMIYKNYGKITFSVRPKLTLGGRADVKNILSNIINNALFLILRIKNTTINQVASINPDSIKPILIKAYKWASVLDSKISSDLPTQFKNKSLLVGDPIYKYILYIHTLKHDDNAKHTIKFILGRTAEKIKEDAKLYDKGIYETIVMPDKWGNTEETNYKYDSFLQVMTYIKNKMYNHIAVPYSSTLTTHYDKYKHLQTIEERLLQKKKLDNLGPNNATYVDNSISKRLNSFLPSDIKIENYYDNNGIPHKFDVYVYRSVDKNGLLFGKTMEYTKHDITNWLMSHDINKLKKFKSMYIVDKRCTVCNTLKSKTKNISVVESIKKKADIKNFYEYYENKCPKGELHNFTVVKGKPSICSKCGITNKILDDLDLHYYNKYLPLYIKLNAIKSNLEKKLFYQLINKKQSSVKALLQFPKWKINNTKILELTRLYKLSYNTFVNLGLTNDYDYNDIETGKINPSVVSTTSFIKLRNLRLYDYYMYILKIFLLIKNNEHVKKLPFELDIIMKKNRITNLGDKLNVPESIIPVYEYYRNTIDTTLLSNFLLHSISDLILTMLKNMKSIDMSIGPEIVKYILHEITNSEKLFSKPDMTKFIKKMSKDKDDTLDSDDTGDVYDDNFSNIEEELDLDDADKEPDNLLSTNDLDIGQGYDDDDNIINDEIDDIT